MWTDRVPEPGPYIFISYARKNLEQLNPVLETMRNRGCRFWYDAMIPGSDAWTKSIADKIAGCEVFMPFLSGAFFQRDNCIQEVRTAKRENVRIFPVLIENLPRESIPAELNFLLDNAEELCLTDYPDAEAFVRHLDVEPYLKPCREPFPAAPDGAPIAPAQSVTLYNPAGPSPAFVGRETQIQAIEDAFRGGAVVVDLYGMGGIGKSEICRKLFRAYTAGPGTALAERVGWVMWKDTLKDTFYAQFPQIQEDNAELYWQRAQQYMRQEGRGLLIFLDNADTLGDTDAARLTALGCRFLVTSRERQERFHAIPAGTLTPEQCRVLYRRARRRDDTLDDASPDPVLDELLRLAAYHTLTVELLAKTQRAAGLGTAELLEKLKESGFDLSDVEEEITYAHRPEQEGGWDTSQRLIEHIARVFDLSTLREKGRFSFFLRLLRKIARIFHIDWLKDRSSALYVLQGMSLLAPNEYLPVQTVKKWLGLRNLNGLNRAVDTGWLNERTEEDGGRSVAIHPVISAVVRHTAPPDRDYVDAVAGELFDDMWFEDTEVFVKKLWIVKHAATLDRVAQILPLETENYGKMLGQMGYLLDKQADYENALIYLKRAAVIVNKVLGTEHRETATTYHNIGYAYQIQGDYDSALEYYQKDLRISEKVLGTEHHETATTYNNIGYVYQIQGDYDSALEWYQKALRICEKVLGTEHPHTAITYNNIGLVYHDQGDYDSALEWQKKALRIEEKILGTEHPDTAITYQNIGVLCFEQDDFLEALHWLEKALSAQLVVLGPEYPDTKRTQEWVDKAKRRLADAADTTDTT